MEDDDEFGDLYTDVLRPLVTTSFQPPQVQLQLPPKEAPKASTSATLTPSGFDSPIDLNAATDDEEGGDGDGRDELPGALTSRPPPHDQTLASSSSAQPDGRDFDLNEEFGQEVGVSERIVAGESDSKARVLFAADGDVNLTGNGGGRSSGDVKAGPGVVTEVKKVSEGKDGDFLVKDEKKAVDDLVLDSGIPGISIPGVSAGVSNPNLDDDWDSDSEDDLQIVLNESNHGPLGMGGGVGPMEGEEEDEDDEDGEPLVIVADNGEPGGHQPMMMMDEQEWGVEDSGPGADGEKKEPVDSGKANGVGAGANTAVAKAGYGGTHGYQHPFHSQFKYVRPGASPIPGAAPGGPGGPGQVRPAVGMVPNAGRGRGDWRPPGIKGSGAMQKGFYQGFGMPVWGAGGSGRGLEFTLPSHKSIFEVDIDGFEEKPWRLNGVDVSDFFNFGLTEESWKDYCKQLEQLRAETTMQGRIRVYESGRPEQEHDPDLPPELAAVAGVQDIQSESIKLGKIDPSQDEMARAAARARPPLPTGRAIQVETGYVERLPSIDTRKPRISDLDVIIEIVCQDSVDDDTKRSDEMADQAETDSVRDGNRDGNELEEPQKDPDHLSRSPRAYNNSHKREVEGRRMPSAHSNETGREDKSEAPPEYNTESREETPVYPERSSAGSHEDRRSTGRVQSRSPAAANKERILEKRSRDYKESSVESIDGKSSPHASSPVSVEISAEPKDSVHDEIVRLDTVSDVYKESPLNAEMENDTLTDGTRSHSSKKQKLSSQSEPSVPQDVDDQEDSKAARSSGNSKARSGSSNYRKPHDVGDEDEVQGGHVKSRGNVKRASAGDEDSVRRKIRDDRQDSGRHRGPVKGREDVYQHKGWDSYRAHGSRGKSETADPRWDIDSAEGAYQQRDEDIHGRRTRAEDLRKREIRDDTSSRQRSKTREVERNEKDENPRLRKQLDNGNWRGSYDKDLGIRHRDRDDGLKAGNENLDDIYSKRRKEEAPLAREMVDKEESLPAHRENNTHRKRQRADVPDQRRRDDPVKARDIDQHSTRHKEDGSFPRERGDRHREREEWYRLKQMNQEGLSKKNKEVARGGMRSGRAAEEKLRGSQSRGKDEHRGSDKDFHPKDAGRQHESLSKRDRIENVNLPQQRGREDFYAHGNQVNGEERRPRHERSVTREDHAASASDNRKVQESKYREIPRKGKEFEVLDRNSSAYSKKHHNETGGHMGDMMRPRGRVEHSSRENETHANNPTSKKPGDEASSDDELSESRRGRSKLERWNSHMEKDFGMSGTSSSSTKLRQIESHNSSGGAPVASKQIDEASKTTEDKQPCSGNENDAGGLETNNSDKRPVEERHLDTVEKLKKRSERFKLPMPSEKEATTIKKMESEPLPSTQSETRADAEVKAERPARKRRWTGS